jgi:nitrite reductase/ring-hydroxylating ferredoxin subunit
VYCLEREVYALSDEGAEGLSRRRVLLMLAGGAVSAGCGSTGTSGAAGGGGSGPCATPADGGTAPPYCLVEPREVRASGAKTLAVGDAILTNLDDNTAVIVARDAGGWHALSAICTHACCLVSLCRDAACAAATSNPGECGTSPRVSGDESTLSAVCPCHGSTFRLSDGTALTGPAKKPLPSFALRFEGDDAIVDTSTLAAPTDRI